MVDVGTQTVSNTEVNSRDLSPSKNNTFINETPIERVDLHSNDTDIIDFDPAIVSIGRSDDNDTSNNQYQTHSYDQLQINVVDQMIAQAHIPYVLLPKHFKPKQISNEPNQQQSRLLNNNINNVSTRQENYFKDNKQWHKTVVHRYFLPTKFYCEPRRNDSY